MKRFLKQSAMCVVAFICTHTLPLLAAPSTEIPAKKVGGASGEMVDPIAGDRPVIRLWPIEQVGGVQNRLKHEVTNRGKIRYEHVKDPHLVVYPVERNEPTPAVIYCPGGGYQHLTPKPEVIEWLNDSGITVFMLKYTVPKDREAAFADMQRAMRVVRQHAKEWNVEPDQIGVLGSSAGGHLVARLSQNYTAPAYPAIDEADKHSCEPAFVILNSVAYLLTKEGKTYVPPIAEEFHMENKVAPTFMVAAKDDKTFFAGNVAYEKALKAAGGSATIIVSETGGHGLKEVDWYPACREWLSGLGIDVSGAENTGMVYNVQNFDAVGDGIAMDTTALQAAVDACTQAGGGTVWVPAGDYVIGTLWLKSNVTLSLDYGATIMGSQVHADYPIDNLRPSREGNSECLLYAEDATNIRLEGLGTIDGRGKPEFFPKKAGPDGKDNRPRLIRFENCTNVAFSGLTYKNPAFWGIHLVDSKDIHISGVTLRMKNNHSNNDGFDIDGCENVLIENCDIEAGDDGICLKSSKYPCRNIVVRNCKVTSHTAGFKCGTSSSGGFIDVDVSNCYFFDCAMGGIKLQIVDGGRMENINISRIAMDNVGAPIFIRLGNRGRVYGENTYTGTKLLDANKSEGASVGSIKGITISDVMANVTIQPRGDKVTDKDIAEAGPILISGIPGHYIEDVLLENITVSYPGGGTEAYSENEVAEDETRYPEQRFFGILPAWGAYVRHAENIEFKNVKMTTRDPDARERIVLDDAISFREVE
ncbi:glycosyl hydrolase family 28 protein [Pontiellaceae bacterium B1224]|nr:glycosyl hydrolase family 28 protein [Pontiellaceae bacterium B1224]